MKFFLSNTTCAREKEEHGVFQKRALNGCRSCHSAEAFHFYEETLGIPIYPVESVELAELCKPIENSHRFVEIAFAEEFKMLCDAYSLGFDELSDAVNPALRSRLPGTRLGKLLLS